MPDDVHYQDDKGDLDVPTGQLPGEGGTPSEPPEEPDDEAVPPDHPSLDTSVDAQQLYDEGRSGASGINAQHVESDEDEHRVA